MLSFAPLAALSKVRFNSVDCRPVLKQVHQRESRSVLLYQSARGAEGHPRASTLVLPVRPTGRSYTKHRVRHTRTFLNIPIGSGVEQSKQSSFTDAMGVPFEALIPYAIMVGVSRSQYHAFEDVFSRPATIDVRSHRGWFE